MEEKNDRHYVREASSSSSSEAGRGSTTPTEKLLLEDFSSDISSVDPEETSMDKTGLALEYGVATRTKYLYLGLYFALNLTITLYNKAVLGKVCSDNIKT